jgi:16S rRNA (guanine527-N7)-methyltransferase
MTVSTELDESTWKRRLGEGAAQLGVPLDAAQCDLLWRFSHLLRERNAHINLTSIVSLEGILTLHMLDSLSVASHLGDARKVIDVGTGGGFPGIPLAVACPERQFTLIDGTQKKIRFVSEAIEALGIGNATALAARAENLPKQDRFEAVVVRAVGTLPDVLHNVSRLVAPGGRLLAMKGRMPADEITALPRGWHAAVSRLQVPGLDAERHVVSLTRVNESLGTRTGRKE